MPYDIPDPVTTAAIFADKVAHVGRLAHVDMALYGTIRKSGGLEDIAALAEAGASAFKVSTYEYDAQRFPRIDHPTMLSAFAEIAKTGLMVAVHNEDQELVVKLTEAAKAAGNTAPIWHCRTRPPITETMADLEIFEMALETGAHVHIAHSSLARGFELAKLYRGQGARTSGEACIQYLCMTEDDIVRLQGFGKCNPPFRTADEVERMWGALRAGIVGYVSTDHAPWPKPRKQYAGDIFAVGAGLTGLQSFAPLMYTLLLERGLPPTAMARLCSEEPARYHGLDPRKGGIRLGADADFCVLEPGDFVFDERIIQDREDARWSPYHGRAMKARVAATYLRGAEIWDGAAVKAKPGTGRFVARQHRRSALDA
jgi:allantoinase